MSDEARRIWVIIAVVIAVPACLALGMQLFGVTVNGLVAGGVIGVTLCAIIGFVSA